jgi:hypothetical protein
MIIFQVLIVIDLPHFHTKNHNKNEKNKKNWHYNIFKAQG